MKTAITFLLSSFLLLASLASHAAIFSSYPLTNVVKGSDLVLLDVATGALYKTRTIAVSNLFSGLSNVTLNVETTYTTNLFVTSNYVVFEYVTNLYASYANVSFAFITNLFVTNSYFLYSTVNYAFMNFAYITNLYSQSLNATQYVATDTNKMLVSTRDGSGWTNLNAANLGPGGVLPPLDGLNLTNLFFSGNLTNVLDLIFRDEAGTALAMMRGGGQRTNNVKYDQPGPITDNVGLTPVGNLYMAGSFQAASSYHVAKVNSRMQRANSGVGGTVRAQLYYSTSTNVPLGLIASTPTLNLSTVAAGSMTDVEFVFSPTVTITNGGWYALVINSPTMTGDGMIVGTKFVGGTATAVSVNGTTWDASTYGNNRLYFSLSDVGTIATAGRIGFYGDVAGLTSVTNVLFGPQSGTNAMLVLSSGATPGVSVQNGTNGPADLMVRGSYWVSSNSPSLWPSIPRYPGDVFMGNSNGVQYQLSSGRGASWLSTNQIGAGPQ